MVSKFLVHHHKTRKAHYDLRILEDDEFRCWSLLKEPPHKSGEQRLAIERERFEAGAVQRVRLAEDAFGEGRVAIWDEGDIEVTENGPQRLLLVLHGTRLRGRYEMRLMRWYPGNRWLLKKL